MKGQTERHKILIVDDSEMNRAILEEMLSGEGEILEAENGVQAVELLKKHGEEISLVLLDLMMPEMDGFGVLREMNVHHWIESVPVIVISAEQENASMEKAFNWGVTDFIRRPFDRQIVRRRALNTILLYAKQLRLVEMVEEQLKEQERQMSLMVEILSHIVEFRNGESGLHVLHIRILTKLFLEHLSRVTNRYPVTPAEISMISIASALHDVGKIVIPSEVLNKPGKLTPEEWEIMKSHSAMGAEIMEKLPAHQDTPLVKTAYQICRWHHERYDGRGYPDGLVGDDIPIAAQVVALADVYDALTSERVYKKAFSHETAVNMILNGECGTFNPLLMDCLKEAESYIPNALASGVKEESRDQEIRSMIWNTLSGG